MRDLREIMAQYGFESNDDYEFQIRCLMESPSRTLRTLNIEGDSDRRKTAFATALARALDLRLVYHDFTERSPPLPDVILPAARDEMGREEPPIERLDQIVSEACAYSEGTPTVLVLDQLQVADFREHLRINRLVCDRMWTFRGARFFANPLNLLVFLISEEPLYHSLQRVSYRIWVGRVSEEQIEYQPARFGLGDEAQGLFTALTALFRHLGTGPTPSELDRVLHDIHHHVRSVDQLWHCIYGWTEGIDRARLLDPNAHPALAQVVEELEGYLGSEVVEVGGPTA